VYVLALASLAAPSIAFAQADEEIDLAEEPAEAPPADEAEAEPQPAPEPAAAPASASVGFSASTAGADATASADAAPAQRPAAPRMGTVGGPDTGGSWEFG